MEQVIEHIVIEKLNRYNLVELNKLSDKNKERLFRIEKYIQDNNNRIKQLIIELKELELSRVSISNCEDIGISRRTIYNDDILNEYISYSIEEKEDYLNEKKIQALKQQLKEMGGCYNRILDNIIDINILKSNITEYKNQLTVLLDRNNNLKTLIYEKENIIKDLKKKLMSNNLIALKNEDKLE
jgi:hypothetical protein